MTAQMDIGEKLLILILMVFLMINVLVAGRSVLIVGIMVLTEKFVLLVMKDST
jgi:hypothetical protein